MRGIVSVKTDVFSFGVILLEIVTGKKNSSRYCSEGPLNLIGFVSLLMKIDLSHSESAIPFILMFN